MVESKRREVMVGAPVRPADESLRPLMAELHLQGRSIEFHMLNHDEDLLLFLRTGPVALTGAHEVHA